MEPARVLNLEHQVLFDLPNLRVGERHGEDLGGFVKLPEEREDVAHPLVDVGPVFGCRGLGRTRQRSAHFQRAAANFKIHQSPRHRAAQHQGHGASYVRLEADVLVVHNLTVAGDHGSALRRKVARVIRDEVGAKRGRQAILAFLLGGSGAQAGEKRCPGRWPCSLFEQFKKTR